MTQKFIGEINLIYLVDQEKPVEVIMPTDIAIPPKKEWSKHPIWLFNGKAYKPLTQKAEESLALAVSSIENRGFTKATKDGKRKPTSIRYAILTTGVEPFYFVK